MIGIKVNSNGKETEIKCEVRIEGRENAIHEFYSVINALNECDKGVFVDALELVVRKRLNEVTGGCNDDKSKG